MDSSVIGTALLFLTGLFSYQGFRRSEYFEQYLFEVDKILVDRQYYRLLSNAFLHGSWLHFGFNMIALLSFSWSLEILFGYGTFAIFYFGCLLGASLLSLYIHRQHGDYRMVGASGASSGVIFAAVVLFPEQPISFVLLPLEIPSWIMAIAFVAISILGIKKQAAYIAHEAHLGGALTGVFLTLLLRPAESLENWWIVMAILLPSLFFLLLIIRNPAVLLIEDYWGEWRRSRPAPRTAPRVVRRSREEELNQLLEKIKAVGVERLSEAEKQRLEQLTKEI